MLLKERDDNTAVKADINGTLDKYLEQSSFYLRKEFSMSSSIFLGESKGNISVRL